MLGDLQQVGGAFVPTDGSGATLVENSSTQWTLNEYGIHDRIADAVRQTDQPLVRYDGSGTGNKTSLHSDERGSITALSYGAPYAPRINRYDEFGKPQSTNVGRFQYTGQMWLPEAGAYHYKNRAMLAHHGRFAQFDPIWPAGGTNGYVYPTDPVNFTDPLGLQQAPPPNQNRALLRWSATGVRYFVRV